MKKLLSLFVFIPFINRFLSRKYYATGIGTYIVNSFFKRILGFGKGGDFLLHFTSRVNSPKNIIIKEGEETSSVFLSLATSGGCYYQAINGIEFGEGTIWANNCSFISANHSFKDIKAHSEKNKIIIGKNVWIGSSCVILPGVKISDNSIIGAGSVVSKPLPSNVIAVGSPAKVIAIRCKNCLDKIPVDSIDLCNNCKNENSNNHRR